MSRAAPYTLRLPFRYARGNFDLARELLRLGVARAWSEAHRWATLFSFSGPEVVFARRLLSVRRNGWLYRCNQEAFCADFIFVDLSAGRPVAEVVAIELKHGAPLNATAGGVQFERLGAALAELVAAEVLVAGASVRRVEGGNEAVLAFLHAAPV